MEIFNADEKDRLESAALLYTQAVLSAKEKIDKQNKATKKGQAVTQHKTPAEKLQAFCRLY